MSGDPISTLRYTSWFEIIVIHCICRTHTLSLDDHIPESIRAPAVTDWLKDVALRDLVLHERHAACIDAKGDVYQWGDGFFGSTGTENASTSGKPALTLRGKV